MLFIGYYFSTVVEENIEDVQDSRIFVIGETHLIFVRAPTDAH